MQNLELAPGGNLKQTLTQDMPDDARVLECGALTVGAGSAEYIMTQLYRALSNLRPL